MLYQPFDTAPKSPFLICESCHRGQTWSISQLMFTCTLLTDTMNHFAILFLYPLRKHWTQLSHPVILPEPGCYRTGSQTWKLLLCQYNSIGTAAFSKTPFKPWSYVSLCHNVLKWLLWECACFVSLAFKIISLAKKHFGPYWNHKTRSVKQLN